MPDLLNRRTMRSTVFNRLLAASLLVFGLQQVGHAQTTEPSLYAVRVAGLTSEERDAVVHELAQTGEARMAFACVPAGVMVFEPTPNRNRDAVVLSVVNVLEARTHRERILEIPLSLADAEAACAEARNR